MNFIKYTFKATLVIMQFFFITVHQGNWHGDIAIKFLDMESTEDEATLEAFRKEVATFRKTRHENLILFMGACMNPPKLAIVTSLCKGSVCQNKKVILSLKYKNFRTTCLYNKLML